uniref:Putative secreted protein n=1 Tax=Anopheles triannulatus TaxID=58253 RepID=A0A2M4B182_9DIPT
MWLWLWLLLTLQLPLLGSMSLELVRVAYVLALPRWQIRLILRRVRLVRCDKVRWPCCRCGAVGLAPTTNTAGTGLSPRRAFQFPLQGRLYQVVHL